MPPKIGKLTQLKTLSRFVVGERAGQRLGELQYLDLGGELQIQPLKRVHNAMEAKEAKLAEKSNIVVLCLNWGYRYNLRDVRERIVEQQQEVMEALKPHPNIKDLTIEYYSGKELPGWMSDPSVLRNVVRIKISRCWNCFGLPALWHLPCLKRLIVSTIGGMEYMFRNGKNLSGGGGATSATAFLSLEELEVDSIPNLKGWLPMEEEEKGTVQQQLLFPRLRKMKVWGCHQMVALPTLPAIEELVISSSSRSVTLLASVSKLTTLTSLQLYGNDVMVCFPDEMFQNLTLLQSLEIYRFGALKVLPENMSSLVALKKLRIEDCDELKCLPDGGIGSLRSLLQMWINRFPKIMSLPDSIQTLTQLQHLYVHSPSAEFVKRFEKGKGQDWYKIAHIPDVSILIIQQRDF